MAQHVQRISTFQYYFEFKSTLTFKKNSSASTESMQIFLNCLNIYVTIIYLNETFKLSKQLLYSFSIITEL